MKTKKNALVFCYLQAGGSTGELYFHSFDTRKQAEKGAAKASKASYDTSGIIEVPKDLADHPAFEDFAAALADAAGDLA